MIHGASDLPAQARALHTRPAPRHHSKIGAQKWIAPFFGAYGRVRPVPGDYHDVVAERGQFFADGFCE